MLLPKGKRVAVAAVAVGLLVIAGSVLAYREELVQRWRTWMEEKVTEERLSRPFPEKHQRRLSHCLSSGRLPDLLGSLSKEGIKFDYSLEAANEIVSKNVPLSPPPINGKSIETVLRLLLASADLNLDYTIKGDTVVIGLKDKK